jgi:hypothetical protein
MRCIIKNIAIISIILLAPFFLYKASEVKSYPSDKNKVYYKYSYKELFDFIYNSTNEIVRLEDEAREIFAKNLANQFADQEATFDEVFDSFIGQRRFLLPMHDLMFKLGLIDDYYYNPYMTLAFKDQEAFKVFINDNAPAYYEIFMLYAARIGALGVSSQDLEIDDFIKCNCKKNFSSSHLIELAKISLYDENFPLFFKYSRLLSNYKESELANKGFVNDYNVIFANYYYYKDDYEKSNLYITHLLDLFNEGDFYYPFTRYVDSFSDIMAFAGKVTDMQHFYNKVVIRVLDNDEFAKIQDPRLVAQIYLNLTSSSVQYLNPDYAYNIVTELYYLMEDNEELNKNYFIQVNKFNIFSLLSSMGDYYNLAVALDEVSIEEMLGNKYPSHSYIDIYKLLSHSSSYEFGAEFEATLVENAIKSNELMFAKGSNQYNNIMAVVIGYYLKFKKNDEADSLWFAFKDDLVSSNYIANDSKLMMLFYFYELFAKDESIKNLILGFANSNYISDSDFRKYVFILENS